MNTALQACLAALLAVYVYWSAQLPSLQLRVAPQNPRVFQDYNWTESAHRLADTLRVKTVSREPRVVSHPEGFLRLHEMFEEFFPLVHKHLDRQIISKYSLLYRWQGASDERPFMLMSHLDVVPAESSLDQWDYEPFAGHVIDGFIYGRGSMDDKLGVVSILEAVELLLGEGFVPPQTIYLSFGHDEEVGGHHGNQVVARMLREEGVRLDFVVDEGGMITDGVLKNVDRPVCLVAVGEKGYVTLRLQVDGAGGHSSMPPRETPIGILAKALVALEEKQMPFQTAAFATLMKFLAPELSFFERFMFSHWKLFRPLILWKLAKDPSTHAAIRTVTSPTMLAGSSKENVLPSEASAVVNFRIAPGDSVASVVQHAERAVNDKRVKISMLEGSTQEPSPISDPYAPQFERMHRTIKEVFPDYHVAPMVTVGMTDARHYYSVSDNVYRFTPYQATPVDLKRFHGINERVSVKDVERCVRFYYQLIRDST